ncbi:hypothetical protein BX600DRAFT_391118 [Xylariales sp. PMI_506]|nr:hypothetical protein BX600DRAFT_391118 [Xylariales sp. PMI_506]
MPFSVPEQYQDQLEIVTEIDQRSDAEILQSLTHHVSVTSEKNIWAFWHSGVVSMPAWCQRNVIDWVRICGPQWTVRVLDNVLDSPNNTLRYVAEDLMPQAFVERTMDGHFVGQHSADFTRTACLYEHGGVWMDVGSILTRHMDRFCWDQLEDPSSPFRVAVPIIYRTSIANHFVAARKGDPFIYQWHKLFTHVWGDKTNCGGIIEHPLLAPLAPLMWEHKESGKFDVDWLEPDKVVEYVAQILCWTRLCCLDNPDDGFSCADHWEKKVLCFDVLHEDWRGETLFGINGFGQKCLDFLALPVDADDSTLEQQQKKEDASKLVWTLLTDTGMQKITHAKNLTVSVHLGTLWDMPENHGKDCGPGTYAELLRHGTVHFRQKRERIAIIPTEKSKLRLKKGVLEV